MDVSPALAQTSQQVLQGELWKRTALSARDRSIVTLAALIARDQSAPLSEQVSLAIDHGVKPEEISEIVYHLAFYAGWGSAMNAVPAVRSGFLARQVKLPADLTARTRRLPLDEVAEAQRAHMVGSNFGAVAPGVVHYTTDLLFRDLWLRPALAPRDRSLVTVCALVASGQVAQIPFHLNKAMDNGLSQTEASEALTQLAFWAGWPRVFSALPVFKEVFEKRAATATAPVQP
jgi:4-carboxymuconolactone decarboxylase